MRESLNVILSIQELDIKMIRLMRMKKQRQDELKQIAQLKQELQKNFLKQTTPTFSPTLDLMPI